MLSFSEARSRVLALAEPLEGIEIALSEAVGLVLAEPVVGDVDLPPFDRAGREGLAVRSADALPGAQLRVVGPAQGETPGRGRGRGRARVRGRRAKPGGVELLDAGASTSAEITLDPGEAVRVSAGDPLPVGADAVLPLALTRVEPGVAGAAMVTVRVQAGVDPGDGVVLRGEHLRAGASLLPAGTRLSLAMVGLLAAQGCVHPVCHRRVRVAVLAVGDHLVGPGEAPVLHRERNAAGITVVAPCLQWGATAHDLGAVSERELPAALARALTAPVVVLVGESDALVRRLWKRVGIEPVLEGVALDPVHRLSYGVVDNPDRPGTRHHVFHMGHGPVGVLTAVTLLVGPLVARLQGGPAGPAPALRAVWSGTPHTSTGDRARAVPVTLAPGADARLHAAPVAHRGTDDLAGFTRAGGLAIFPAGSGPWEPGTLVEVVPLGTSPVAA